MQEPDLFKIFVDPLDELAIPYIVTGAVASIIYGEPRLTHDIDLVLELFRPGKSIRHCSKKFLEDRSLKTEWSKIQR